MEAALEISFYVLAGIVSLGVLMVLILFKDIFFHGRFTTVLPPLQRVPNTALDAARDVLQALKAAYAKAQGQIQENIGLEMRHMENRIAQLEDKAFVDQADYYDALKARERTWREWRSLHEEAHIGGRARRKALRPELDDLKQRYARIDREVKEEYQRAVARDVLTLEELKRQGVLEPEVLYPREPAAEEKPAGEEAAPAEGQEPGQPEQAPAESAEGAQPDAPTPSRPANRWKTPLAPYPPAQGGELRQVDLARPEVQKSERTYVDETMRVDQLPGGMMQRVNFNLSSFAEVRGIGVHRYVNCTFVGTDLRRLELTQAEGVHLFQDCDFKGASLAQSRISQAIFRRCNLSSTHWRGARLDRVKFESCNTDAIHWEGIDLSRTLVSEDMVEETDFSGAVRPPRNLAPPEEAQAATAPPAPQQPPPRPATGARQPPAQPAESAKQTQEPGAAPTPQPEAPSSESPPSGPPPRQGPPSGE